MRGICSPRAESFMQEHMEGTKTVDVTISNTFDARLGKGPLPSQIPMEKLVPLVVVHLGINVLDAQNRRIPYRFIYNAKEIGIKETLEEAGVHDGDNLILSREGIVGSRVYYLQERRKRR